MSDPNLRSGPSFPPVREGLERSLSWLVQSLMDQEELIAGRSDQDTAVLSSRSNKVLVFQVNWKFFRVTKLNVGKMNVNYEPLLLGVARICLSNRKIARRVVNFHEHYVGGDSVLVLYACALQLLRLLLYCWLGWLRQKRHRPLQQAIHFQERLGDKIARF